ncbi:MAG TPA: hypothetical protein VGO58_14395, partial [Chitinophagaceae bacterium]|nr:hypothetical protein [Chitinophagaceae bacterium]
PDTGAATGNSESKTATVTPKTDAENKADAETKAKIEAAERPANLPPVMSDMDNGKSLLMGKCTGCHLMKNAGDYTFSQWQNILRSMVPKAKLSGEEEKQLTAYIKANAKQ